MSIHAIDSIGSFKNFCIAVISTFLGFSVEVQSFIASAVLSVVLFFIGKGIDVAVRLYLAKKNQDEDDED